MGLDHVCSAGVRAGVVSKAHASAREESSLKQGGKNGSRVAPELFNLKSRHMSHRHQGDVRYEY